MRGTPMADIAAPTPAPSLRPRGIADLLDTAFRLYRQHVGLLLGISAIMLLPLTLLHIASLAIFNTAVVVELIQNLVFVNTISAALIYAGSLLYQGRSVTRNEAYKVGWRRVGT